MSAEDILNQQTTSRRQTPAMKARAGYGPKTIPPDIARQVMARANYAPAPIGTQQQTFQQEIELPPSNDTLAVYSVLPANAGYFNVGHLQSMSMSFAGSNVQNNVTVLSYTVPAGRVALLRSVRVNIEDWTTIGIPTTPFTFSVARNGNTEVFNQNIFIQAFDGAYPVFMTAQGPNDIISVTVSFNFNLGEIGLLTFITHLEGDILIQNELPTPYTGLKAPIMKVHPT